MVRESSVAAFYESLRHAAFNASGSPVWIFPSAADADSLCAFRIVTLLLKSDSVRYSAYPVAGPNDIKQVLRLPLDSINQTVVVLLLNWGASSNLLNLLRPGAQVKIFVIDSHRPIHLQNLSELNSQVTILYTREDEDQGDMHYGFNIKELADFPDLGSDADESEEEDSDDESSEDDADLRDVGGRKRRRAGTDLGPNDDPNLARLKKNKSAYYSKGSFHGIASGYLLHEMSHALHKNTNEILWLACVSLTDQFVHERLSNERYQSNFMTLEQHVSSAGNLDVTPMVTLKDGTKVRVPDVSRIVVEDEPRLMLLREWTLYDSMSSSSYVATKFKTWTDSGMHALQLLLANMGIPLVECKEKFQHMKSETKKNLKSMFDEMQTSSGLTDLYYRSFQMFHGYSSKLSAADVVFGVTALLETWKESSDSFAVQFWEAFEALSASNLEHLRSGMHMAIKIQRAIIRQGSLAIAKKNVIRYSSAFRFLVLDTTSETQLLAHPLALTRFCYFLMDALKEQGHKPKPLLCSAPVPGDTKYHLLVGVSHRLRIGAQHANKFGLAFEAVAKTLGVDYGQDAFESSWIQLDKDVVNSFMMRVQERLSS